MPGEVTAAELATGDRGDAQNPIAVAPFVGGFSGPPTQKEVQAFAALVR